MEPSRALIVAWPRQTTPLCREITVLGCSPVQRIPREDLDQFQRNVIRSHSVGVGDPFPREWSGP